MIAAVSPDAAPGNLVRVYDKFGQPFGSGLYNPNTPVPLRVTHYGSEPVTDQHFTGLLQLALDLRIQVLRLPEQTDAFRVVHAEGDGLSGLVVDKYGDTLIVDVCSLGVYQRLDLWLQNFHSELGTKHHSVHVEPDIARVEGIRLPPSPPPLRPVRIREHGLRFQVDVDKGLQTGFFCDHRENRRRLAQLTRNKRVLDLCCGIGGFSLAAVSGGASEVTGVSSDEPALAQARHNANLNQFRLQWVHCDPFSYARQMRQNQSRWDVVVLDSPDFIESDPEGLKKLEDLNILGLSLVEPGGWFVTCSCAGLLSLESFEQTVIRAAHRQERRIQFLDRTGAGPDYPVMSNCLESRYLNVLWARAIGSKQ